MDRGFFLTLQAIRRQVAAMPNEFYLIRFIHPVTRTSAPGERLWTADLSGNDEIRPEHLSEAIQYRSLDRQFWNV